MYVLLFLFLALCGYIVMNVGVMHMLMINYKRHRKSVICQPLV